MDRVQFVKSIEFKENDFVKCAIEYFDHEMLLYNLVGKYNEVHIEGDSLSPRIMKFSVNFKTDNQACEMLDIINRCPDVLIYGKSFHVNTFKSDERIIEITLQKLN